MLPSSIRARFRDGHFRPAPHACLIASPRACLVAASLVLLSTTLIGCATNQEPLASVAGDLDPDQLTVDANGVTLTLTTGIFPDEAPDGLAAIRIDIVNQSGAPLEVRYADLVLASGEVETSPMPSRKLADAAALAAIESDLAPLGVPDEEDGDRFRTAQQAGPLDATADSPGAIGGDAVPTADDFQHNYWDRFDPPTETMFDLALPETTLENGQSASGFVYFRSADAERAGARFKARLEAPDGDATTLATPLPRL